MSDQKRNHTTKAKDISPPSVRARLQHSAENTSDYLEVIAKLITETGEARVVDVARLLGVSKATVTKKIAQLQREGLVRSEPYRSIFLEPQGAKIAEEARRIHEIVLEFLIAAGVSPDDAEIDAEGIEHHVSSQTISALKRLTERIRAGKL